MKTNELRLAQTFTFQDTGELRTNKLAMWCNTEKHFVQLTLTNGRDRKTRKLRKALYRLDQEQVTALCAFLQSCLQEGLQP